MIGILYYQCALDVGTELVVGSYNLLYTTWKFLDIEFKDALFLSLNLT